MANKPSRPHTQAQKERENALANERFKNDAGFWREANSAKHCKRPMSGQLQKLNAMNKERRQ